MAAVTAANITTIDSFMIGTASNKTFCQQARFSVVLATQGATAGDLTAALLGFAELFWVEEYRFVKAGPAEANISLSTDGTNVFTFTASDATTGPANVTGTVYFVCQGRPL